MRMTILTLIDIMKRMAKNLPKKIQVWVDARQKFHLSHVDIQMARELGLNPKKLGSLANHKQERWKAPLPEFIEDIYFKRFGKERPDVVLSIEDLVKKNQNKKTKPQLPEQEKVQNIEPTCREPDEDFECPF